MTRPVFEIAASLRATGLLMRMPPEAATSHHGAVALERECVRSGLPESQTVPGGRYEQVAVRTCLFARVQIDAQDQRLGSRAARGRDPGPARQEMPGEQRGGGTD